MQLRSFLLLFIIAVAACKSEDTTPASPFEKHESVVTNTGNGGMIAGDIDHNGLMDLVSNSVENYIPIVINGGSKGAIISSSFQLSRITADASQTVRIADIDGDKIKDLIVIHFTPPTRIAIYRQKNGTGVITDFAFDAPVIIPYPFSDDLVIADMDNDGKQDIIATSVSNHAVLVYKNQSTPGSLNASSFAEPVSFSIGYYPYIAVGDLNGDGKRELVIAQTTDPALSTKSRTISVYKNNTVQGVLTKESFQRVDLLPESTAQPQFIDMDGDKRDEMIMMVGNMVRVFQNSGTGDAIGKNDFSNGFNISYGDQPKKIIVDYAINDINNDGSPDMVLATTEGDNTGAIGVFKLNFRGPTFLSAADYFATSVNISPLRPVRVLAEDFDGDGKVDIGYLDSKYSLSILRNVSF